MRLKIMHCGTFDTTMLQSGSDFYFVHTSQVQVYWLGSFLQLFKKSNHIIGQYTS